MVILFPVLFWSYAIFCFSFPPFVWFPAPLAYLVKSDWLLKYHDQKRSLSAIFFFFKTDSKHLERMRADQASSCRSCWSSSFVSTVWHKPADTCNSLNMVQSRQIPTTSALRLHAWSQCVLLVNKAIYVSYSSICWTATIERRRELWPIGKHMTASKLMDV